MEKATKAGKERLCLLLSFPLSLFPLSLSFSFFNLFFSLHLPLAKRQKQTLLYKNKDREDRLKPERGTHVDRIGVQSTFIHICAGLRVLMIWAKSFFQGFEHVFSFEKSRRFDDNQQITVSYFGEHKRLHLESCIQN